MAILPDFHRDHKSPPLMLAPMQDITDLAFLRTLHALSPAADLYTSPYFRVVSHSCHPDRDLAEMIEKNPTGKPLLAQIIGSDIEALCRMAERLHELPIAGIDLNIGCPAPIVCRKDAGGGALRNPARLDRMLSALRDSISGTFTVKTRLGYTEPGEFEDILEIFRRHSLDLLVIHGRTVREGYQTPVHPELIRMAATELPYPVFANGNIVDTSTGAALLQQTKAQGLMIGRGAVRNPWLFEQLRQFLSGEQIKTVRKREVLAYISLLFEETARLMTPFRESSHIHRMKKFLVYIAQGLPSEFEYRIRRTISPTEFHSLCRDYLENDDPMDHTPPVGTKLFAGFEKLSFSS